MRTANYQLNGSYCPYCGGRRLNPSVVGDRGSGGGDVRVVECPACDVAWQWPLGQTISEGLEIYAERYAGGSDHDSDYFDDDNSNARSSMQCAFVRRLAGACNPRLLDVGAGTGYFVREAVTQGFDASGVEPALANPRHVVDGLDQGRNLRGTFEDLSDPRPFDVITLWDVVEHVEEPYALLGEAYARLNKGGWLIVETGNYQSRRRITRGTSWWAYHVEHRWYLSPPSIEMMLRDIGFSTISVADTVLRPNHKRPTSPARLPLIFLMKTLRAPWNIRHLVIEFAKLKRAQAKWPDWIDIPIFAIAAQAS